MGPRRPLRTWATQDQGLTPPVSPPHRPGASPLPLLWTVVGPRGPGSRPVRALAVESLSWPRQGGVDGLLPVGGAVRLGHAPRVGDGGEQGPLGGPHVGEGRVQPRGLAGVGVVGARRGLVVRVLGELRPRRQRREGGAVVRQAERGVGHVGARRRRHLGEVAPADGGPLALDLGLGGVGGQRGGVVRRGLLLLLLLGQPAGRVAARRRQRRGDAVGVGGGPGPRGASGPARTAAQRR